MRGHKLKILWNKHFTRIFFAKLETEKNHPKQANIIKKTEIKQFILLI